MPEETAVDRGLYIRCPSCQGAELRPACEECGGAGFIPTGMTMGMLSRIIGHAKEGVRVAMEQKTGVSPKPPG